MAEKQLWIQGKSDVYSSHVSGVGGVAFDLLSVFVKRTYKPLAEQVDRNEGFFFSERWCV